MRQGLFLFILIAGISVSCGTEPVIAPKPRTYPRVVFPAKEYVSFQTGFCKMSFEYPTYAKIKQDTLFFNREPEHPCWFDVFFPQFNASVHCTYSSISSTAEFEKLQNDAFKLTYKHTEKASFINEVKVTNPHGVSGFIFNPEGHAASSFQFFLTDSTSHFFRGSLYFRSKVVPDSLAPIQEFIQDDVVHMINTFSWK